MATIAMLGIDLRMNSARLAQDMASGRRSINNFAKRSAADLRKINRNFGGVLGVAGKLRRSLLSLKTAAVAAFAGWGIKSAIGGAIEVGSNFDKMRLQLRTITKQSQDLTDYQGDLFDEINKWAMTMPVTTGEAIKLYTQLRAMGMKPTLEDMTALVDTTLALGGGNEVLAGIGRALGQMATKQKVVTQEMLQLAERGVPAFEILREQLGLSAEDLGRIGELGLDANKTIAALIAGMRDRFGGSSEEMKNEWDGLTTRLKSTWVEFVRLVMDSGVMQFLKDNLQGLVQWADDLYQSGTLQAWAENVAVEVIDLGLSIREFIRNSIGDFNELGANIESWAAQVQAVFDQVKAAWNLLEKAWRAAKWFFTIPVAPMMQRMNQQTGTTGLASIQRWGEMQGQGGNTYNLNFQPQAVIGNDQASRDWAYQMKTELDRINERYR